MELDYTEFEKKCAKIEEDNKELIDLFKESLTGLSPKTIRMHVNNVSFYLNDYLAFHNAYTYKDGLTEISDFFGYFFIRKCMWSTPATMKSTAASFKKFYKCMLEHGKIEQEEYKDFCDTLKYNMEDWQEECEQFNNWDGEGRFSMY